MVKNKLIIRETILGRRKSLSSFEVQTKSRMVTARLMKLKKLMNKERFSLYLPINNEVETKDLINKLVKRDKHICLPCFLKATGQYCFVRFGGWQDLETGPFGILQPKNSRKGKASKIEVAIVPGVAFSRGGVRLGYGKGIYDKLLAGSDAFKVGLAFDFQVNQQFTVEKHDLRTDMVVTEKRILDFST